MSATIAAPLSVIFHELGHLLTYRAFGINDAAMEGSSVSLGKGDAFWQYVRAENFAAAADIYPLWQVALGAAAGPIVSVVIILACCLIAARKKLHPCLFRFVLAAFFFATLTGCGREVPDPCKLVTIDEVRSIAPEVTYSKAVDSVDFKAPGSPAEGASIKTCVWRNASDVDQVLLTSKAAANPDGNTLEEQLKRLLRANSARVVGIPSIGQDAAAAFYGSGNNEVTAIIVAQNGQVYLDLRPIGVAFGEKSSRFAAAAALMKTALDRSTK